VSKREKPFNNPFGQLKLEKPKPPEKPSAPKAAPPSSKKSRPSDEDEAALFLASVGEVYPVRKGPRVSAPPIPARTASHVVDSEVEALTELAELVAGTGSLDVASTESSIEAAASGLDPRILKRLRAGDYSFQAQLDLHGLTRAEAKDALTQFILQSRSQKKRCVLVVHGRGLHSEDQIPVLKETVQSLLARGRLADSVLAFTSARPQDGGTGAVYVLLRR
jgi:DNA-nicking Smr family endonuclease